MLSENCIRTLLWGAAEMQKKWDTILDRQGRPVEGATVQVNLYPGGGAATIYSDDSGTQKPNPLVTDEDGYFEYYAANGHYTWITTTNEGVQPAKNDILHDDSLTSNQQFIVATGTGDAMVVSAFATGYTLVDGDEIRVRAPGANTVTNPTISLPGVGVLTIFRQGGAALVAGDVVGAGHELLLRYRAAPARVELVADAGTIDASRVIVLQSGTGALSRTAESKLRELSLSIMDFTGADNTGATDQTATLILAMNKAFASATLTTNLVVDLPDGEYLFTQVNPFGSYSVSADARQHVTFRGNGRYSTRIRFKPGGSSDAYLYDGSTGAGVAAADNQFLYAMFKDIGFIMDETGMSAGTLNIIRQFPKAGAPNQNFQFRDCYALGPSTVARAGTWMVINGTINGAENSWNNCRASQMKTIIDSTNPQAVNHYVFGCDWESMVGDIYKFVDGGGQLPHVGGSIIFGSTLAADAYVLNCQASVGQGTNFNFYGIKTELSDTNALIVNLSGTNNAAAVNFRDCDFGTTGGAGSRIVASVQPNAPCSVLFERCNMIPTTGGPYLYEFKAGASNYWLGVQYNGRIEFQNCKLPTDIHDRFSWGSNSNGLFRIRGGINTGAWTPDTDPNISWDCDLLNGNPARSPSSAGPELKTVWGAIYTWPDSGANTAGARTRLKLPVGAIIKAIKVHRIAFGGTATAWSLAITNDDGTYTYGIIAAGAQNVVMDFADAAVWRPATSGVNQYVRVLAVKTLAYNTQTANFTVGATLTDAGTATTAKILADADGGATGTLTIGIITGGTGLFGVGNIITDGSGGSATAGATTDLTGSNIQRAMAAGDIYAVEYY